MNPHIGKFKDIEIELPKLHGGLSGHFRIEAFQAWEDAEGHFLLEKPGTRHVLAEFDNIISNQGLDYIGNQNDYGDYCHVGTGTATEANTDTALGTFKAGVVLVTAYTTYSAQGTPPYYGGQIRKYRFSPNFGPGNISVAEVGISRTVTTGNLFSRARIKDGGGSPTTISVLSTEYLDVYYTLRNYPDHVNYTTGATDDGSGSIDVSGTPYSYTIRCADITNYIFWARNIMRGFGKPQYDSGGPYDKSYGTGAALGAVTASPTGVTGVADLDSTDVTAGSYSTSSYQNTLTYAYGLSQGNRTGSPNGIRALWLPSTLGAYQLLFSATIPKDGTKLFTFNQRWAWTRKTL